MFLYSGHSLHNKADIYIYPKYHLLTHPQLYIKNHNVYELESWHAGSTYALSRWRIRKYFKNSTLKQIFVAKKCSQTMKKLYLIHTLRYISTIRTIFNESARTKLREKKKNHCPQGSKIKQFPKFANLNLFKPNASLEAVTKDLGSLTKNLGDNDIVIVLGRTNNQLVLVWTKK